MNKAKLIELMAKTTKMPKSSCKECLEAFVSEVSKALKQRKQVVENVPKPVNTTCFLCLRALLTSDTNASRHSLQDDLGILVVFAISSINLALFIQIL